jgi:formylglycine-generating enzyme required for sulfatase activity
VVNGTSTILRSRQSTAPVAIIDQGAFWKACRNTGFLDADGNTYYLSLPSDPEWLKAADWGDLNHDGTIDIGPNASVLVATREQGGADAVTVRCHTDDDPWGDYNSNSSETANCRSRYGAADMVGNVWEWTTGQIFTGAGYDNGLDGSWLGKTLPTSSNHLSSMSNRYDLFRGYPTNTVSSSVVTDNGDYYWYASTLRGAFRGGVWSNGSSSGRFALFVACAPSSRVATSGGGAAAEPEKIRD